MKKNQEPQPAPLSSEETDSDASSSSSDDGVPPSYVAEKSSAQNKSAEPDPDDSDCDSPIAKKPLSDGSNLKKPGSKPNSKPSSTSAAAPSKTPAKRKPALNATDSKRPKKENNVGDGAEEEGKKSALFQRLWSDDDEIEVLKGILEYEEKGADPMVDTIGFHDFIKNSLHVDFDRKQLMAKIRRLKKRYANSVFNKKKNFTAHELNAFDLSSKIWGNVMDDAAAAAAAAVGDQQTKSNMKTRNVSKAEASKGDAVSSKGNSKDSSNSCQFIGQSSISMGLDENIVKVGLELCGEDKKAEIEEKWKQLYLEESNIFLRKLDLAREESKMIAEALKSGGEK